jgi:type VI secretion system protein ImpE
VEPPEDLRDCVWTPAHLLFENGGEVLALIPTRYEGSQDSADGELQLARKTEWVESRPDVWTGLGQRVFSSSAGEHPLMDARVIAFSTGQASPQHG